MVCISFNRIQYRSFIWQLIKLLITLSRCCVLSYKAFHWYTTRLSPLSALFVLDRTSTRLCTIFTIYLMTQFLENNKEKKQKSEFVEFWKKHKIEFKRVWKKHKLKLKYFWKHKLELRNLKKYYVFIANHYNGHLVLENLKRTKFKTGATKKKRLS